MKWPFGRLRRNDYGLLYADPAWRFNTYSEKGRGKSPDRHYRTLPIEQLMTLPVWELAARDCALALWIYNAMVPDALRLMTSWGFEFKTVLFVWDKETEHGADAFGNGYYSRHGTEQCWLGTIGNPPCLDHSIRQKQRFKLREHSRKPDEFRPLIERMFPGPYCELFARTNRAGWQCWGDEAGKFGEERLSPP